MTFWIIEGCDCSGKTTLIEQLKEALNMQVIKGSSFEHSQCTQEELYQKFDSMIMDNDTAIFDRFIYSNEVYASLYDDYAMLSCQQRRDLEWIINHMSVIIYLYASEEVLAERLGTRGDDYVKSERIPSILAKYDQALLQVDKRIPILSYDTEMMSTEDIVKDILKFKEEFIDERYK